MPKCCVILLPSAPEAPIVSTALSPITTLPVQPVTVVLNLAIGQYLEVQNLYKLVARTSQNEWSIPMAH